jgi:ComF family protein
MMGAMGWEIDMVVPVPLGGKRQSKRGYNQAAALAKPLSWSLGLDYKPKALRRIRETASQVGLSKPERRSNVFRAFYADKVAVAGKRILIVDDVMTTGATLEACAHTLKQANAEKVYGLTLSRATDTRD